MWNQAIWDEQYRSGTWDYLASLPEMARSALIAAYIRHFVPSGRVLDVRCGEGHLYDHLHAPGRFEYTGIDFSQAAIEKAAARHPETRWFVVPAEEFVDPTGTQFDSIVFNEVLYLLADPTAALAKYKTLLMPQGILVVSIFMPPPEHAEWLTRVNHAWQQISATGWTCLDMNQIWSANVNISWRVAALAAGP